MRRERAIVVGAGVGGLAAAVTLAARGAEVIVCEAASTAGGKMREVEVGGARLDAGPTVFTMRWVFDEIFRSAGVTFSERIRLQPLTVLARHAWDGEARLDLFADVKRSAEAIGDFAGAAEARGYLRFCERARRVYQLLENPFIRQSEPRIDKLMLALGLRLGALMDVAPFATLWGTLGAYFRDARLRQLFARYATYCGSSPFLAPATLMLIAHVEQAGVWSVEGGMYRLIEAMAGLATEQGVEVRYGVRAARVLLAGGRASGIELASGERLEAAAVIFNGDVAAIAGGLLGDAARRAVPGTSPAERSLSAITWLLTAKTGGFPLSRHNVFFSRDYAAEFDDILRRSKLPGEPTVYVCAQDRSGEVDAGVDGAERLLCLVNAPASADAGPLSSTEIARCQEATWHLLERRGLRLHQTQAEAITTPNDFGRMFPGTGGALYGQASHGWRATFERPGCRTRIAGLYVAGGSAHPGPGVPMAALSGRMAAECVLSDLASTSR